MARSYDYIIVGSGIAGLLSAMAASERGTVLLLTKGAVEDSNSRYAQGGIAAAVGMDDSPEMHLEDTLRAGAGICDEEAARIMTHEGPNRIAELVRLGVVFDQLHGKTALAREGAHRRARVLHVGGDATGAFVELHLSALVRSQRVDVQEHASVTEVAIGSEGRAIGVRVHDARREVGEVIEGAHIILATGGGGRLFRYTTNPDVATADGVALAFRAGAQLMDMEFFQFHPTALRVPGAPCFLISEAVRGEGGILCDRVGHPFMQHYHPSADLAPRDVVVRAIVTEMERSGTDHVLLDVTHQAPEYIAARFPTIYQQCLQYGVDATQEPIPVAPAAHYMMGGIKTNVWGETSIPGLYACGEVSCTGAHGANRLASNSLLETIVFSSRIVERTSSLRRHSEPAPRSPRCEHVVRCSPPPPVEAGLPPISADAIQECMWRHVGILRSAEGLHLAADLLGAWSEGSQSPESASSDRLRTMALVGWLMAQAALLREESRGAHYRNDYPETRLDWACHLVIEPEPPTQ